MLHENHLELQALEFVCRLDDHIFQAAAVQGRTELVLLIVVRGRKRGRAEKGSGTVSTFLN